MALELGNVVGKVGGGGELITDPLGMTCGGGGFHTLHEFMVTRKSFVAAQHDVSKPAANSWGSPLPFIRITQGGTEVASMTPSSSTSNFKQPFRATAVLDPGTYQVQFDPGGSRTLTVIDLYISVTPIN